MRLDANSARNMLARYILRILYSIEANWAQSLIIESCHLFIFDFLLNHFIAINWVISDLLAHDEHFSLCEHLAVGFEDGHFVLVYRRQLVKYNFKQTFEKTWIEGTHSVEKVCQAIILHHWVIEWHSLSNLSIWIDLEILRSRRRLLLFFFSCGRTLTTIRIGIDKHHVVQAAEFRRQILCRATDSLTLGSVTAELRNGWVKICQDADKRCQELRKSSWPCL